jgi:hypothetical protein
LNTTRKWPVRCAWWIANSCFHAWMGPARSEPQDTDAPVCAATTPWSGTCTVIDLATCLPLDQEQLPVPADWDRRWTLSWRAADGTVSGPVRTGGAVPIHLMQPVRGFSWATGQRHRPGLQFMVSTGRHHGFESLAEQRLLLVLDFAGQVRLVLGQPVRLRFTAGSRTHEHVPDVLAVTRNATWLFDVRPADRVRPKDVLGFAATARLAVELGWRYTVVTGWRPHVLQGVEALSAQRRPLHDPLGVQQQLLQVTRPQPFGELAASSSMPAVARAHLLHLLWRRRLEIDLRKPVGDATLVRPTPTSGSLP